MANGRVAFEPGEVIFREGDPAAGAFLVESGTVTISTAGEDGHVVLATLGPGDLFGEIAVIASGRRTATVESLGPMVLASFFKRDIWALEKNNVAFADALRALRETHDES